VTGLGAHASNVWESNAAIYCSGNVSIVWECCVLCLANRGYIFLANFG
jgi:hypothetical protein